MEHKNNVHSQNGEDGIIQKILQCLPQKDQWCVEFGAWDGRHLSNTYHLIESHAYSAVLIEGDSGKFHELTQNNRDRGGVICMNAFVGFQRTDGLDALLHKTTIPQNFDVLSIDIDGNDHHVWSVVEEYRPKVVCIEFNPTIPVDVQFVQAASPVITQGASLRSLVELGKQKKYELVAVTLTNALFVDAAYFPLLEIADNRPEVLWTERPMVTYLFNGYDGTVFLRGHRGLGWHPIAFEEYRFQVLPSALRTYPGNYRWYQRKMLALYVQAQRVRKRLRRLFGIN